MKQLDLRKELYANSSHLLYISMSKKEALVIAQNLLQQVNCDVREVEISMSAKENK